MKWDGGLKIGKPGPRQVVTHIVTGLTIPEFLTHSGAELHWGFTDVVSDIEVKCTEMGLMSIWCTGKETKFIVQLLIRKVRSDFSGNTHCHARYI